MMAIRFIKDEIHTLWNGNAAVKRTHQGLLFRRTHVSFRKSRFKSSIPSNRISFPDSSISTEKSWREWEKTKSSRKIGKRRKEAVLVIKAVLLVISSRWLLALFGRWRI